MGRSCVITTCTFSSERLNRHHWEPRQPPDAVNVHFESVMSPSRLLLSRPQDRTTSLLIMKSQGWWRKGKGWRDTKNTSRQRVYIVVTKLMVLGWKKVLISYQTDLESLYLLLSHDFTCHKIISVDNLGAAQPPCVHQVQDSWRETILL